MIKTPVEHNRQKVLLTCPTWNSSPQANQVVLGQFYSGTLPRKEAIALAGIGLMVLRCSEIATLTLDDFDWYNGVLTVRRAKRGRVQQFPSSLEVVAEAVIRYLRDVRGRSPFRNVFPVAQPCSPAYQYPEPNHRQNHGTKARGVLDPPCGLPRRLRHGVCNRTTEKRDFFAVLLTLLGQSSQSAPESERLRPLRYSCAAIEQTFH